jgi:hypothetical protein
VLEVLGTEHVDILTSEWFTTRDARYMMQHVRCVIDVWHVLHPIYERLCSAQSATLQPTAHHADGMPSSATAREYDITSV